MQKVNPTLERIHALRAALAGDSEERKTHHTIGELMALLQPLELALGGIVFSVPFLQPVPLPGLSTPIGLAMATLAVLRMTGRSHVALPRRLRERRIDSETMDKILGYAEKMLTTLGKIPHWEWGRLGRLLAQPRALSAHIAFMALLLSLPLPIPFSNSVPAWGIIFACLAMIEANGIYILASYVTLIGNLIFFGGLFGMAATFFQ
ncbi:MAG: hypothetical protein RLZZ488_1672 [Pseudomonadota bacterium]|jgi:hypothetical protein